MALYEYNGGATSMRMYVNQHDFFIAIMEMEGDIIDP